jgi:protein-disulfide isomerase
MVKKRSKTKKTQEKKGTNWLVIGGVGLVGVIGLFALLFLAIREPEAQQSLTLAEYCSQNDESCASIGSDNAPVTFIEVSDFGCPHCRDFHLEKSAAIKENFVETGQVKWVFLPYALRPETVPPANAALCAAEQGKYSEFADSLFSLPTETALTRNGFLMAADDVGLNIESFTACVEEGRYNKTVGDNQQAARAVRVSGTPTFFVNDQIVTGNVPLAEFERLFNQYSDS